MDLGSLEQLKILLNESTYPQFTDEQLTTFLTKNNGDVYLTASELCLLKANGDKKIKIGPITIEGADASYWMNLRMEYKAKSEEELKKKNLSSGGLSRGRMRRADDRICRRR